VSARGEVPDGGVLSSGIAQILKAFKGTKNLIKGLRYNCFKSTNEAGRFPPVTDKNNSLNNVSLCNPVSQGARRVGHPNYGQFKEVVKAGRTTAATIARPTVAV